LTLTPPEREGQWSLLVKHFRFYAYRTPSLVLTDEGLTERLRRIEDELLRLVERHPEAPPDSEYKRFHADVKQRREATERRAAATEVEALERLLP
jgi:hypothetical protein